jgi:two-component system, LytTR family, response regulator
MSARPTTRLKAVIVDDERLARNKLRLMLAKHPEIQVVGEADSARLAREAIEALKPDVIFLDIQMPGETGFDLLASVSSSFKFVFVTAFDEYAIRAFEVNALDYLLKPVNPDRLARSVERLTAARAAVEDGRKALDYDDHLFLTLDDRSTFLKVSRIQCILAAGPYSDVVTSDGRRAMVLKPMKEWEGRLPEKYFMRIHRSTIINLEYVERVEKWFNYSFQVYLRGITEPFTISRRYATRLKERLR